MTNQATISQSLLSAVRSQLNPKMLALLGLPWLFSVVLWLVIGWLVWAPLTSALVEMLAAPGSWFAALAQRLNVDAAPKWVAGFTTFVILVPLALATAMTIVAVFSMPAVLRHLSATHYSDVARQGSLSPVGSGWNAIIALALFVPGYLLTIPLWFVPVVGLLVPAFWWGWLNARMMRFDSLAEHASTIERTELIRANSRRYLLIGIAVSALNYIPPLFLITPVLSALAFGHFSLAKLRNLRALSATNATAEKLSSQNVKVINS